MFVLAHWIFIALALNTVEELLPGIQTVNGRAGIQTRAPDFTGTCMLLRLDSWLHWIKSKPERSNLICT